MREIKFRAWEPIHQRMFECEVVAYNKGYEDLASFEDGISQDIIMQFTSIQDKNGVDIYEGDILGYKDKRKHSKTVVKYNKVYAEEYGMYMGFNVSDDLEVIGNIYENPELLTE